MSMTGLRTNGRIPLLIAFCSTVMSLVRRVMRDEVLKWSRFRKEKPWTLRNSALRSSAPKPWPAKAASPGVSQSQQ